MINKKYFSTAIIMLNIKIETRTQGGMMNQAGFQLKKTFF